MCLLGSPLSNNGWADHHDLFLLIISTPVEHVNATDIIDQIQTDVSDTKDNLLAFSRSAHIINPTQGAPATM